VMRRCPTILTAAAAALILTMQPTPAGADATGSTVPTTTVGGTLTFPNGLPAADPNATTPQVILPLVNPGSIVPPPTSADNPTGNPLLIDKTTSTGFDPTGVVDLLSKDNKQFGLSFFGTGINPGGKLDFTLNVDKAFATTPIFQDVAGINNSLAAITPPVTLPPPTPTPTPTTTPTTTPPDTTTTPPDTTTVPPTTSGDPTPTLETPEPMSLLLWSILGGLGLWHSRRRRRTPVLPSRPMD
jgi:hypothetical protein